MSSVALLSVVLVWGVPAKVAPVVDGPRDFRAYAYRLRLQVDRELKQVKGIETIQLRAIADRLEVVSFPRNGIDVRAVTSDRDQPLRVTTLNDQIEIQLAVPLRRGQRTAIDIVYVAVKPKGVVFQQDAVYTVFHTCHWMVCRERPDDKATLDLSVVGGGGTLVGNGARGPIRHPHTGPWIDIWRDEVPSSPYLFGFALGEFDTTERVHRGVVLRYYAAEKDGPLLSRMFADDDRMLDFFVEKAGRPLPRPVYAQVVVEGEAAQELSSFSILGRNHLAKRLDDPTEDWLVAHELAHQFWGNLVTCADWSHFWLNEGLVVFMVAAYKERRWGRPAYERELGLLRGRHQAAVDAGFDAPLTFAGEYPSLRMKRAIVYSKGALFLDRLRTTMGDRAFWAALRKYTRRFAGRTATTRDLQRVFAAETREDLSQQFDQWAYGSGWAPRP